MRNACVGFVIGFILHFIIWYFAVHAGDAVADKFAAYHKLIFLGSLFMAACAAACLMTLWIYLIDSDNYRMFATTLIGIYFVGFAYGFMHHPIRNYGFFPWEWLL